MPPVLITLFDGITAALTVPPLLAALYCGALALVRLLPVKSRPPADERSSTRFAILVPAHNEEAIIGGTIDSLQKLQYPAGRAKIFVVADNCTDRTAPVARAKGVCVLERTDYMRKGKGHALQWGLSQIRYHQYDAVLVIDADCVIDANALGVFSGYLRSGFRALQANDRASNPDESPRSLIVSIGNSIENDLYWSSKSRLGLAVFLRGTGMVLHRSLLEKFPWKAYGVAEDTEYSLELLRSGETIKFIDEVAVRSSFPSDYDQLKTQRLRWSGGNASLTKSHALRLIAQGILHRNAGVADAGISLLVNSRPMLGVWQLLALGASAALAVSAPGHFPLVLRALNLFSALLFAVYAGAGFAVMGITRRRIGLLRGAPAVGGELVSITVMSMIRKYAVAWDKTPRQAAR